MKDILNQPISKMAENLTPIEGVDHLGQHYQFQKFRWMQNYGIMNAEGTKVLIPAIAWNDRVYVRFDYEAIIAGGRLFGWVAYSLDCTELYPDDVFPTLHDALKALKDRRKAWLS